jgi:thermitase
MRTGRFCGLRMPCGGLLVPFLGAAGAATLACLTLPGCGAVPETPLSADVSDTSTPTAPSDPLAGCAAVPDELVVGMRAGADRADAAGLFAAAGVAAKSESPQLSAYLVTTAASVREQARSTLTASPLVEGVWDNAVYEAQSVPNDPLYAQQWHLPAINAPAAWDVTTGSDKVIVAVLDTGVDGTHPDLQAKLLPGANTYDGISGTQDVHGHGTSVAGVVAAATGNQRGVAALAWNSPILPIRVSDDKGRATTWALAAGIQAAVTGGAKVINISFAPLYKDTIVLRQAQVARLAGSLVIIATGNDGKEVVETESPDAVFVGAVDQNGGLAWFSTYGSFVDLVAPGVSIYTTKLNSAYAPATGTSFAAPIVSGVAALLWSVNPQLRPATVEAILVNTAKDLGATGRDNLYGAGRVDASAAVRLAQTVVEARDTSPPAVSIVSPPGGATIGTPTAVSVWAYDSFGVADVTLSVDGATLATDAVSPYEFILDPAKLTAGMHTLTARATDTSGNAAEQAIAVVCTAAADPDRPVVTIRGPKDGATVRGIITVLADASDNRGLDFGEVLVDGHVIGSVHLQPDTTGTVAYNWNTAVVGGAGSHTLTVRVYDASGNQGTAAVRVTVVR